MGGDPFGDPGFGMRVHRGRGLDEDQYLRVDPESPGQHDALALTSGEATSTLVELTGPTTGQRVVAVLRRGGPQQGLRQLPGQHTLRVHRVLQRAGEELAAGVADQDPAAYIFEGDAAEVDSAVRHTPRLRGASGVAGSHQCATVPAFGAGTAGPAAAGRLHERRRLVLGGEPAAEPV